MDDGARKLQERFRPAGDKRNDAIFGGVHIVLAGDFAQHQPVMATPLFHKAVEKIRKPSDTFNQGKIDQEKQGRAIWKQFTQCFMLKVQHRFSSDTPSGKELYDMVQLLMQETELTDDELGSIVDTLNARYPHTSEEMKALLEQSPKIVVLRNKIKAPLNHIMYKIHASNAKQRLLVWNVKDTDKGSISKSKSTGKKSAHNSNVAACNAKLSMYITNLISKRPLKETGGMESTQYFFPGIMYKFIDNDNPEVGRINNTTCIGRHIVLDEREEADSGEGEVWQLKYLPKCIFVQPDGFEVGNLHQGMGGFAENVLQNCIPITLKKVSFKLLFLLTNGKPDNRIPLHAKLPGKAIKTGSKITVLREGMPLEGATTFSSHFAQGVSFGQDKWFLHLKPPSTGVLNKANLLVPITRPSLLSDLWLLAPLYTNSVERAEVIRRFKSALKPDAEYNEEMNVLRDMSSETYKLYDGFDFDLSSPLPTLEELA